MLNKRFKSAITRGKDELKSLDKGNVAYRFNYKQCPAVYVRKTKRTLRVQKGERRKEC